ncbi:DUF2335 domain-containing protein [Mesorhizobium sp. B2-2-2]|uniref:DUF2335 domain-containing protein n=1 Tax=Mesorhizobium sp. B2-2-2 TaxID=2589964 RepID=UPI0011299D5B|nr:DUF2335 domain-containing protein [Mesorhizobium sp. B2-2-2]TPM33755.1 DUF2335 domain-containing protein [Mesorhizobium sp. B2-2-2]
MKKPVAKRSQPQNSPPGQNHTQISVHSHKWEAPIPPPEVLERFSDVVENGAERIVTAWEGEIEHRRDMEKSELRRFYNDATLGKILAFLFVALALSISGYAASVGAEWFATILAGGTIAAVVGAFVKVQTRGK